MPQEIKIVRDTCVRRAYDFIYSITAETPTVINVCGKCKKFEGKLTFYPPLCLVPIYYTDITFSKEVEIEYTVVSNEHRKKLALECRQQFFQLNEQSFLAKRGLVFIGPVKKNSDWYTILYDEKNVAKELPLYPSQGIIYGDILFKGFESTTS